MSNIIKKTYSRIYRSATHLYGRMTKRYDHEDHIRAYLDGIVFNEFGRKRRTGVIVSQRIGLSEAVMPKNMNAEVKKGLEPGTYDFEGYKIDTTLLHNTYSWIAMGINQKT